MPENPTTDSQQQGPGGDNNQTVASPVEPLSAPGAARSGLSVIAMAAVIVALVAGLAAGAYWHDIIGGWFGGKSQAAATDVLANSGRTQLWTCGMHPQVIRDKPGTCPICHMKLEPVKADDGAATTATATMERKIKYWWDPMLGPSSISDKPGKSAMGMELVPGYEDEVSGGAAVTIDPVVVQNMGVRVTEVTRGPVQRTIRAVGSLEEAQPRVHDVNLRVSGWIEKLYADTVGAEVTRGEPLFELYSPQVQVALDELITAQRSAGTADDELAQRTVRTLVETAKRKLELWGLGEKQIEKLATLERAPRTVTFLSPVTGHITEKAVVEGAAVEAGQRVLRIVDHSELWLDAQVYEQDLPFIKLGQKVTASMESMPGKQFEGKLIFIHPHVDPITRTATVRVALPNPDMLLRPGMYATAQIQARLVDDAVLVPREAVIDTGEREIVFIAAGNGRFEPRKVELGSSSRDGMVQVLGGLAPGETVVISGQFLLDSESRMKEAIQKHLDQKLLAKGNGNKVPAGAPMSREMQSNASVPVEQSGKDDRPATAPAAGAPLAWSLDVDNVYREYLELARTLGAVQKGDEPLDLTKLIKAATVLSDATPLPAQRLPKRVLSAATAMDGKPLAEQRKLFKTLSEAVIAMADVCPPSKALGNQLYVAHCPMALETGADWLQTDKTIANPYYATEMKRCGEITRSIETAKDPK